MKKILFSGLFFLCVIISVISVHAADTETKVIGDADNRPIEVIRNGEKTIFEYGKNGKIRKAVSPQGTTEYTYYETGKIKTITNRDKSVVTFHYDSSDRIKTISVDNSFGHPIVTLRSQWHKK